MFRRGWDYLPRVTIDMARTWSRRFRQVQRKMAWLFNGAWRASFSAAYAERRAEDLLVEHLTAKQQEQYLKSRSFTVKGGTTGCTYLITQRWAMNIYRLGRCGEKREHLCFHTTHVLPVADNMLAQKIMLESSETEALAIANEWSVRKNWHARYEYRPF